MEIAVDMLKKMAVVYAKEIIQVVQDAQIRMHVTMTLMRYMMIGILVFMEQKIVLVNVEDQILLVGK